MIDLEKMAPYRFVHTADWQLGRPFGRFEPELSSALRRARIEMIDLIAAKTRDANASDVLVAGDVFDSETPSRNTTRQALDALGMASDLVWWLLPGNHDPAREGGLWDRLAGDKLPPNVRVLKETAPVEMRAGVWLLPAPWRSKDPGRDLTADFSDMQTPDGALRIGIAHGGVVEFDSEAPQSAAIAPDRARLSGLDYLALGDWHGRLEIGPRTHYSGTPEPDRFPANDPGYVLGVEIDDGKVTTEVIPTASYVWAQVRLDLSGGDRPEEIVARLAQPTDLPKRRQLLSVALSGRLDLSSRAAVIEALHAERDSYAYFEVSADDLTAVVEAGDLDRIDREGVLREAADTLAAEMANDDLSSDERKIARHALDLLASYAREAPR